MARREKGDADLLREAPTRRRRKKTARLLFIAVIAAGSVAAITAWRSRRDAAPLSPPQTETKESVSLAPVPLALPDESSPPARLTGRIQPIETWEQGDDKPPAVIPPALPTELSSEDEAAWQPSTRTTDSLPLQTASEARSQVATYRVVAPAKGAKTVTHRLADGDTLALLAQRYLGSADRWVEIFAANRDRLAQPDLLPIGTELRIEVTSPAPAKGQ